MERLKRLFFLWFLIGCQATSASLSSLSTSHQEAVTGQQEAVTASTPTQSTPSISSKHEEIQSLARQGLLDSALHLSQQSLKADSTDVFAMFMVAKLSSEGKVSGDFFRKRIKASGPDEESEESYFRQGQYCYAAGKYTQAIPLFRDYLRLYPVGNWRDPALYWMGNACLSLAQSNPDKSSYTDSALGYFQTLSSPQNTDAYYLPLALEGIAKTKAAMGDLLGAVEAATVAMESAPEEEKPALLLLSAQLQQGLSREEEKRLMDTLVSVYPHSPEARYIRKLNIGLPPGRWKTGSSPYKEATRSFKDTSATPVVSRKNPTPFPPTQESTYTLQLGAFSQVANAKSMAVVLARLDLVPEIVETKRNGKIFYQVRLGRFPTLEAASEYAQKVLKPHELLSQPVPLSP